MPITIASIMEAIARDVDTTYRRLRKDGMRLTIPEVDVTLSLEVELDGEVESPREEEPSRPVPGRPFDPKLTKASRFVMDDKLLAKKGFAFRSIATPARTEVSGGQELRNLEVRFTFVPEDED